MTAAVSSETHIYERMLLWAVWATDRRHVPDRRDELAGDFRLSETTLRSIEEIRARYFPKSVEAVEKAVASLKLEHDEYLLFYLVDLYFLKWKTIAQIARQENLSEFHVEEFLRRAMRLIARRLPAGAK